MLARLAYLRAVGAARAEPTAANWSRLLAASNNLNAAVRQSEGELGGASPGSQPVPPEGA